ncbi:MAG: BrnT family toxin [Actinobacteria bacterium]|nr:BrnT family toxin [Actinomycetota bacterium]MBU4449963.1 BrnT family toxin [Actinomycetota bacterium]
MDIYKKLEKCTGFEWDKANIDKNLLTHNVSSPECEQAFLNIPLISYEDLKHSQKEARYYALGKTDANRFLYIVFTIRNKQIRIISARDMNKKERQVYINYEKDS